MEIDSRTGTPVGLSQSASVQDLVRVERLLQRLAENSVATVRFEQGEFLPSTQSGTSKLAIGLAMIVSSLTTFLSTAVYFRTQNQEPQRKVLAEMKRSPLTKRPELQERQSAAAVNRLANALEASSKRLHQLKTDVDRTNKELAKIASSSRVRTAKSSSTRTWSASSTPIFQRTGTRESSLGVKPTDSALPHIDSYGNIDYWLIPHGPELGYPTRVIPLGESADGVFVYNMADRKNYRLTHSGEWFIQPKPPDDK